MGPDREARIAFEGGRWTLALQAYLGLLRANPGYSTARFRIADALLNLDRPDLAARVYRAVAWLHIRGGQPLLGLAAATMLAALEPSEAGLTTILGELYSADSGRVGDVELQAQPDPSVQSRPVSITGESLLEQAATEAADTDGLDQMPEQLPPLPLFSDLVLDDFHLILDSLKLRRFGREEAIVSEGDPGEAMYMLAEGQVRVERDKEGAPTTLARLPAGSVFGEMALISKGPRVATVRAEEECSVFELARDALEARAGALESVKESLRKFTRGRLLANLAATSPLFTSLPRSERRGLMAHFKTKRLFEHDILIEEGEPGRGLFLLASGKLAVIRGQQRIANLGVGAVVGELSLLHDIPTTATVTVTEAGDALVLVPRSFRKVLGLYPDLERTLRGLSKERLSSRSGLRNEDAAFLV